MGLKVRRRAKEADDAIKAGSVCTFLDHLEKLESDPEYGSGAGYSTRTESLNPSIKSDMPDVQNVATG
jgi:hypothetical protein